MEFSKVLENSPHPDAGFPMTADQAHLGQLQSWDAPPPGFSESCLRRRAEGYLLSLPCPGQLHGLCHGLQGTKDHPNGPAQLQKAFLPQSVSLSSTSMWMGVGKSLAGRGNPLGWVGWVQSVHRKMTPGAGCDPPGVWIRF